MRSSDEEDANNPNTLTQFANILQNQLQQASPPHSSDDTSSDVVVIIAEAQKALREELSVHMMAMAAAHEKHLKALEKRLATVGQKSTK